jgi:glycosyltransferase involved in cell wall biosynthesis
VGEFGMRQPYSNNNSAGDREIESVIVVGIVRDIEKSLAEDIKRLSKALRRFTRINWFLVESGSSDQSIAVLERFSNELSNFSFQQLAIDHSATRTENMAKARNRYLDHLRQDSRLDNYQYVVIVDFNNLNSKINHEVVESCFQKSGWDVVTANQSGRYYDAWALRHPLWSPNDCWEQHEFFRKYTRFPESAITYALRSRMLRIPANSEWIEVDSAFGGFAIYKSSALASGARYEGLSENGNKICEHVPFHYSLKDKGFRIFINPSLINTRSTDHSHRISTIFTFLRICRYPLSLMRKRRKNV